MLLDVTFCIYQAKKSSRVNISMLFKAKKKYIPDFFPIVYYEQKAGGRRALSDANDRSYNSHSQNTLGNFIHCGNGSQHNKFTSETLQNIQ